jgi:hypothetical protein
MIFPDGCDPLVHRRSVNYETVGNADDDVDNLLCDDLLPFGWYRFMAYGM